MNSTGKELTARMREAIDALEQALGSKGYVLRNPAVAGHIAAAVINSSRTTTGANSNGTANQR